MKIQIMSDLHQEHRPDEPSILPENIDCDLLILAGDICSDVSQMSYLPKDIPILHVLGNHEYYGKAWEKTDTYFQEEWRRNNFAQAQVLEMGSYIPSERGVRFLGATLWTDFWTENHSDHQGLACKMGMSDFYVIEGISIHNWFQRHLQSLNWLKAELAKPFDGKTVVITHHAPSFKSNELYFADSNIRAGFCSELDYLIEEEQPYMWIHGHTHFAQDYQIGNTRVLCNPLGYPREGSSPFNTRLIVEV